MVIKHFDSNKFMFKLEVFLTSKIPKYIEKSNMNFYPVKTFADYK